jgi:DNA-binding GntR family transcriptional regulator
MKADLKEVPPVVQSDSDQAYERLLAMIVDLTLAPGAFLNEQALATQLDLGRTPVREALARLSQDRFVTILPRRGIVIAPLTFDDVLDMFEARETIECGIAFIAATHVTESDVLELKKLVAAANREREGGEAQSFLIADHAVHTFLVHMIRNPILQEAADRLLLHNLRFWRLYWSDRPARMETMLSHAELLSAIESRDSQTAEKAMRDYLQASLQLVKLLFDR